MNQGVKYSVDLVFCIDVTGSMQPIIDTVKSAALKFYDDLNNVMEDKGKAIDDLRVRVVAFRDYYVDGDRAMKESEFWVLPDQKEEFHSFVSSLVADGGGDEPESGLEALALSIKSSWNEMGDKKRQIIVVWTDASGIPLERATEDASSLSASYPSDMLKDFDEMTDLWEGQGAPVSMSAKRLIMFAPDAYPWTDIATHWENTLHYTSRAGEGLDDVDYGTILDTIANSV